jgi:pimeloyl-ACP methyl ester carboxylesterase
MTFSPTICLLLILAGSLAVLGILALVTWIGAAILERDNAPRGRFVPVDGATLHVDIMGPDRAPGPPIVLVPGANSSIETMRVPLGELLSRNHRVILIDRPGQGWSRRTRRSDATPAIHAHMIVACLDQLAIDRAIFVGHSWGGAVLPAIALQAPHRVTGLVMLAAVTHPWDGDVDWIYRACKLPILGPLLANTIVLPVGLMGLRRAMDYVFFPQKAPQDFVTQSQAALVLRPDTFLNNAWDMALLRSALARQALRYSEIQAPVILIAGDNDCVVSTDIHSRQFANEAKQAELVVLPDTGHMPHVTACAFVQAAIEQMSRTSIRE